MRLSRLGIEYTLATGLTALAVFWIATLSVDAMGQVGAAWGSGIAFVLQSVMFWALFVGALRDNWLLAHGLGLMFRFIGLAVVAFVLVPAYDLPAAPTVFAFVGCLGGSILLEPVFLKRRNAAARVADTAQLRTLY
jgi:hypothetical protein